MAQTQPYISLDSVITDYLNESEQGNHKYFKLFHLAFRGMEQLGLDAFYQIKSVKLPVNSNLTVQLPPDYMNWTKVGILNDRGEIIPLYYNDKLTTYADLLTNRLDKTQDDTLFNWNDWGVNSWFNYWNGYSYVNFYGVPSGAPFVGSFKVDTPNGVILLGESFAFPYIMLEYVSSPEQGGEYHLPVQFREAMIAWLSWKDSTALPSKTHVSLNDKAAKRQDFYNERRNAIARWKPTRMYDRYQASQEQTRLAVKS